MIRAISDAIKIGYRPQAEDTAADGDALGFWLFRQRTPQQQIFGRVGYSIEHFGCIESGVN